MTATTDSVAALIARLREATGADREIDADIAVATFATQSTADDLIYARREGPSGATERGHYYIKDRSGYTLTTAPEFTASIDTALTLLPAEKMHLLDIWLSWEPNDAGVCPAATVRWYPPHKSGPDWHAQTASGRTPALALCVCALEARRQTS